ncbi:methylthioribose-1-phosphate isomerase [Candidatus Magnetominusculus xianensis]|uniref:Methylthioribose-1-phosphate isomerase n=2 Tax=Candidatus Magnetominusculus xianensis TaxID=1748249 RepID=A0ABR5SES9_9BACT|nr:S-methyl-5-thioribose-1-phosphate isomerase [Candidatus Magnetominusculus xianensis]KWT82457.1 methylthioribose-1-phosphate isomerase [Candidatus Magnetominusculus xianensis]MBF0403177.1 S-methyl-5-thioribose-1-phosphate isomerase [Nitrospirota bacterium]
MIDTIKWIDGAGTAKAMILDQTRLPHDISYIECTDYRQVVDCIKYLAIRGAPAIGIAAAMGIALAADAISAADAMEFSAKLRPAIDALLNSRPTAVNIQWAAERIERLIENNKTMPISALKEMIAKEGVLILNEDIEINKAIGRYGAEFIKDGDTVLTHCNAGALATGGYGTATAPIRMAIEQGKRISVIADETRPILQGARLTAWELMQDNIPVTLIPDNAAGELMRRGEIDLCIVGTDRTVRNGDVANKIGTYSVAVLAKENNIPFYVAAPLSSIDFTLSSGSEIPIEERPSHEVTNVFGRCEIAPKGVAVRNIAFDVTPAKYITLILTEKGAFKPEAIHTLDPKGNK